MPHATITAVAALGDLHRSAARSAVGEGTPLAAAVTIAEGDEELELSDAELEERDAVLAAGLAEVMRGEGADAREVVALARQRR